jgi:hypothetical protein
LHSGFNRKQQVTDFNMLLHVLTAILAAFVAVVLFFAGRSIEFRYRIGPEEHQRAFNFRLVGIFIFSLSLDVASAPLGVGHIAHLMAVCLACTAGLIVSSLFAYRIALWKF